MARLIGELGEICRYWLAHTYAMPTELKTIRYVSNKLSCYLCKQQRYPEQSSFREFYWHLYSGMENSMVYLIMTSKVVENWKRLKWMLGFSNKPLTIDAFECYNKSVSSSKDVN